MPIDPSLAGRAFPATEPYLVSAEKVREFATAAGGSYAPGDPVPATFPIVLAFASMNAFLRDVGVELQRIVHGDQRFTYERPLAVGDVLTSSLTVSSVRQLAGNDIVGTVSEITDASGALVCTARATIIHRGGEQ